MRFVASCAASICDLWQRCGMASRNGPPYPTCGRYVGSYLTQTGYGGPFGPRRASWRPWREELPGRPDTGRIWWPAPGRGTTRACVADVRGTFVSDLAGGRKTRRVCVKQHGRREGPGRLCQSRKGPSYAWRPFVSGSAAPRRLCQTRAQGDLPQTPVAFQSPSPFATSARCFPAAPTVCHKRPWLSWREERGTNSPGVCPARVRLYDINR